MIYSINSLKLVQNMLLSRNEKLLQKLKQNPFLNSASITQGTNQATQP